MALNIREIIASKLQNIPPDHLDRSFLEAELSRFNNYLEGKNGKLQGQETGDYFLQFLRGPYLDRNAVLKELSRTDLTYALRSYGEQAVRSLDLIGPESLYHLCLPTGIRNRLIIRRRTTTMTQLRRGLEVYGNKFLPNKSLQLVNERLQRFDQLVQESQTHQS